MDDRWILIHAAIDGLITNRHKKGEREALLSFLKGSE